MVPFDIEVEGGEPTLHPDILTILQTLNKIDKCQKIQLITNIVKPLSFFEQLDKPEYNKLEIAPSYHPEYHKKDKYVKKLIQKLLQFREEQTFLMTNILKRNF